MELQSPGRNGLPNLIDISELVAERSASGLGESLLTRVLDEVGYGIMLATASGELRFANHTALAECAATHTIRLHDGHLQARLPRDQDSFAKALAQACAGQRSVLRLSSEQAPMSVAVVPLGSALESAGREPLALLLFGKRLSCEPLSVEFYAQVNRLTLTETTVLKGLCSGLRPAAVSKELGIAVSTVRSHIGSMRLKTGASSIGQLVRMVSALPPIVPALNRLSWGAAEEHVAKA
jgi:DNA-binding CsgD family transcriptional regulator